jgi:putative heme iron utilization protein
MDQPTSLLLGSLVLNRPVAALATTHDGKPFASMIPYAVLGLRRPLEPEAPEASGQSVVLVTHVSRLSAHTRDMLAEPDVCLLIMAPDRAEDDAAAMPPQSLPRVSLPCLATFISPEHEAYAACRDAYLTKFPYAAEWFQLGDFSLVVFTPTSARLIAGFARAMTLSPHQLHAAVVAAAEA